MKFGFLTDPKVVECGEFTIAPLPDFQKIILEFYTNTKVSEDWIYGPEVQLRQGATEKKRFKAGSPITNANFFRIVSTHEISSPTLSDYNLRFLILGYSFIQGVYLSPEGYLSLGRVPYRQGKLTNILPIKDDYVNGMEQIQFFHRTATDVKRKLAFSALHWLLIGQTFQFEWDKFDAQYKVLDCIYRLSEISAPNHASRPVRLANKYNISLPKWAELDPSSKTSILSKLRNELVHEAKYAGEPIGYAYPSDFYSLELVHFNIKLLCSVLGINTPYLKIDSSDRNTHGWAIIPQQNS